MSEYSWPRRFWRYMLEDANTGEPGTLKRSPDPDRPKWARHLAFGLLFFALGTAISELMRRLGTWPFWTYNGLLSAAVVVVLFTYGRKMWRLHHGPKVSPGADLRSREPGPEA